MKIAYLFTTFPRISETFLQREVRIMAEQGIRLRLYTLWGGQRGWEGRDVYRLMHYEMIKVIWRLPKWLLLRPDVIYEAFQRILEREVASPLNLAETIRGYAFAIVKAHHFKRDKPDLIHCTWATMPASAGWLLSRLTNIPFSMGAHAYDVHKHGGDRLLPIKVKEARLIHTTTESCRERLVEFGASPQKLFLIRRGMEAFPHLKSLRSPRRTLRILAVGRLVPKKGYADLISILHYCQRRGLDFQARIIGGGDLMPELLVQRNRLNLDACLAMPGAIAFDEVKRHYEWADVMCFTGKIAQDGDRDGLPNVIPEAMAWGLNLITTDVAGTTEAVEHGQSGCVLPVNQPERWLTAFAQYQDDDALCERYRTAARAWVEANYDNRKNTHKLAQFLCRAASQDD